VTPALGNLGMKFIQSNPVNPLEEEDYYYWSPGAFAKNNPQLSSQILGRRVPWKKESQ
jgi:hypothetical protein